MPDRSSNVDHRHDRNAAEAAVDASVDADREKLLEERRARHTGTSRRRSVGWIGLAGMLVAGVAAALALFVGPTQALKTLGFGGEDQQKTSQVDLQVDRVTTNEPRLDFAVPEPPAAAGPGPNPNAETNKQLEELRKEIDAVARANKGSDVSLAGVQNLLDEYNKEMTQKLKEERERAKTEDARGRAEASRLEQERERSSEVAKLDVERRRQLEEIATKQRESTGVVVDESQAPAASAAGAGQRPEDLSGNDRFLASAASSEVKTSISRALPDPSHTVVQGTIVSAVLETAINTELPGNIRAQVIEPVFSFDGSRILLPGGTSLIGTFSNRVDVEQKRVLIAWNRAITPDGQSIALGSTGADLLGRAGTEGNVDNRYVNKIGAAVLISAITALPSSIPGLTGGNKSSSGGGATINIGGAGSGDSNAGGQTASKIAGALSDQGETILDKYLSLPPIIRVPQGEEIRVFVNQDLVIR
ncbi:TrbI/VirB10 family protein [Mesorhizobium sp. SARCC-RB16n]|uniref:TrbI/VirB10 family protein n=1 Tax=Mesorhizobium sp. SARCC-RB16n TaxID=2116687 RepID=UPI001FEE5958|nr:TrbI/VirB10 family protein [Mesorhizobium sp. SARCC-RB16n]